LRPMAEGEEADVFHGYSMWRMRSGLAYLVPELVLRQRVAVAIATRTRSSHERPRYPRDLKQAKTLSLGIVNCDSRLLQPFRGQHLAEPYFNLPIRWLSEIPKGVRQFRRIRSDEPSMCERVTNFKNILGNGILRHLFFAQAAKHT